MKLTFKDMSLSRKAAAAGTALAVIALAAFIVYGAVYTVYYDLGVIVFLLLGALCSAAYVLADHKIAEFAPLAAVLLVTFALGLCFLNSYPVWADWYGGFTMYGSQGGIVPVVIVLALLLLGILAGIISCFTSKGGGKA